MHEGVVRPFINLAQGLESKREVSFALLRCNQELAGKLRESFSRVICSDNKDDLIYQIKNNGAEFIITDDDPARLRLLNEAKRASQAKSVCYAQILYGCHALASSFDLSTIGVKERVRFSAAKQIPFHYFSGKYARLLQENDLIVANSKITAAFLQSIYGVDFQGVVYPPTDIEVFKPSSNDRRKQAVTVYTGSHLGDVNQNLVGQVIKHALAKNLSCNVFGNKAVASKFTEEKNPLVTFHSNLSDTQLAELYSSSLVTVCPQKWETFGYVPVESMSCGTPALAFNCMGSQETVIHGKTGWLANNTPEFLRVLDTIEAKPLTGQDLRDAAGRFSIVVSAQAFLDILENASMPNR